MIRLKDFVRVFEYDCLIITDEKVNILMVDYKEVLFVELCDNEKLANSEVVQCFTKNDTIYITVKIGE